jgi:hypothetical protein
LKFWANQTETVAKQFENRFKPVSNGFLTGTMNKRVERTRFCLQIVQNRLNHLFTNHLPSEPTSKSNENKNG